MCIHCDYKALLESADLEPTAKRLKVLEIIGSNSFPLAASDIYDTMGRDDTINRVTVYRILDLLVDRHIVEKISTGGRAAYYGLAPNEHHRAHPHFYCKVCGRMDCLNPDMIKVETGHFEKTFPGRIDKLEMRIDGICKDCLRKN